MQGYTPPPSLNLLVPIYTPGWREGPWGEVFCQRHNTTHSQLS